MCATAPDGFRFFQWSFADVQSPCDDGASVNPCVFTVTQPLIAGVALELTSDFSAEYTVTVATEGRGTAVATPAGPFLDGDNVALFAATDPRARFVRWDFAGSAPCPNDIGSTTCSFSIRSNVDATAVFASVMTPQSFRMGPVGTPIDPLLINVTGLTSTTFRAELHAASGSTPPGLQLETIDATSARITGTPTEAGEFMVRIFADDGFDSNGDPREISSDLLIFVIAGTPETTVPDTTVPGEPAPDTTAPGTTVPGTTDPDAPGPGTTVPGTTVPGTTDPDAPGSDSTLPNDPDSQTPATGGGAAGTHPGGNAPLLPSAGTGLNNTLSAMGILLVALGGLVLLGASTRRRVI